LEESCTGLVRNSTSENILNSLSKTTINLLSCTRLKSDFYTKK